MPLKDKNRNSLSPMSDLFICSFKLFKSWISHLFASIASEKGYIVICSAISAYIAIYSLAVSKHERDYENANSYLGTFYYLVSGKDSSSFRTGLNYLSRAQLVKVNVEPTLSEWFNWFKKEQPNINDIELWAERTFRACTNDTCSIKEISEYRIDLAYLDFEGVSLPRVLLDSSHWTFVNASSANFLQANISSSAIYLSDFIGTDLSYATIINTTFRGSKLIGAKLTFAKILNTKFYSTHLIGADLSNTTLYCSDFSRVSLLAASFSNAKYNSETKFPENFDPEMHNMVLVETEEACDNIEGVLDWEIPSE